MQGKRGETSKSTEEMIDIFKLTDFGDPGLIVGSRVQTARKYHGLKYVRKDWINSVALNKSYLDQFMTYYGFDEKKFLEHYGLCAVQFGN